MDNFPAALVIASYDAVCHNNNVLYRLVRPLPDGVGVQSTDRLVNVVPFRRKYMFERKHQLVEFAQQILKRPLVLQPVLHFGRGIGHYCAAFYQDELWIVMVNQTHPKILSRLQMGIDAAKGALERGQPFEIKFRFGKLIQRVYREHLSQKERGEAEMSGSTFRECLTHFRYAEWEHCDLNLRYHGFGASTNRTSALRSLPNLDLKWDFEDIGMHEMIWSQPSSEVFPRPHLSPVYEDEIRAQLKGWTVNSVSPLENTGHAIPEDNYDYARAGHLFASYRKKKRPHTGPLDSVPVVSSYSNDREHEDNELIGAVGYDPSAEPEYFELDTEAVEHDFGYHDRPNVPSRSRQKYYENVHHPHSGEELPQNSDYSSEDSGFVSRPLHASSSNFVQPSSTQKLTESRPDRYGHIHANVEVRNNVYSKNQQTIIPNSATPYANQDVSANDTHRPSSTNYHSYTGPLKKQDSDRSSRSTNADSGYCPDGDGEHSRGGSYDYNEQNCIIGMKQGLHTYETYPTLGRTGDYSEDGLENPAFRYDDDINVGVRRTKQLISNPRKNPPDGNKLKQSTGSSSDHTKGFSSQDSHVTPTLSPANSNLIKAPPRQKKINNVSSGVPQIAESFI